MTAHDAVPAASTASAPSAKKREAIQNLPGVHDVFVLQTSTSRKSLTAREISRLGGRSLAFGGARHPEADPDYHQRGHGDGEGRKHIGLRTYAEPHLREHHHRQRARTRT